MTTITAALGTTTLMSFSYNYGTNTQNTGRVLSRTDAIQPEHSVNYTYDSIYRLNQVQAVDNSWSIAWTFDTWGNRLTQTPAGTATSKIGTQTLGFTNNRVTTYSYDAAGNQLNDGNHNYTFNAENQITQMDGGAAVYAYDGEGRRMKKTVGGETTYYFYGPQGLICEFSTTAGVTQAAASDRTTYRTSDHAGTAVLLISPSGTVVENNRTFPYGENWLTEVSSVNKNKFTTYERDSESGLDYGINRFSQSVQGRFTSADKGRIILHLPQSLNRYIYTMNDPINRIDPDGNQGMTIVVNVTERMPPSPLARSPYPFGGGSNFSGPIEPGAGEPISPNLKRASMQTAFCDTGVDDNFYKLNFISTYSGDAAALSQATGLDADFILAWAAMESGWGVGWDGNRLQTSMAQANNNFFGLLTSNWVGAVECPEGAVEGAACFNLWGNGVGGSLSLLPSGWSALTSGRGRYLQAGLQAQRQNAGNIAAIAEAIAREGFNSEGRYGEKVSGSANEIKKRQNCP